MEPEQGGMVDHQAMIERFREAIARAGRAREMRPGFFAALEAGTIGALELWSLAKSLTPVPEALVD